MCGLGLFSYRWLGAGSPGESLCLSPVRVGFSFPTAFWVSQTYPPPLVFTVRLTGVSSLQGRSQSEKCLIRAWTPNPPQREASCVWGLFWWLSCQGWGVGEIVSALMRISVRPFLLCCGGAAHLVFKLFFSGNYSLCMYRFGVSMEQGECWITYATTLNYLI